MIEDPEGSDSGKSPSKHLLSFFHGIAVEDRYVMFTQLNAPTPICYVDLDEDGGTATSNGLLRAPAGAGVARELCPAPFGLDPSCAWRTGRGYGGSTLSAYWTQKRRVVWGKK